MEERVKFYKDILSRMLSFKDIMFTYKTKIELGNDTNDYIRLSPKTKEKLKNGYEEAYNLVNRPKKIPKVFNDWGGISYHDLSKILILDGTLKKFSYR